MMQAQRLRLLQEIRHGEDSLIVGHSHEEQTIAMAKLREWEKLAERFDIILESAYTLTADGARLRYASAALTPSGRQAVDGMKQPTKRPTLF
jgi:hypothetical protein